MAPAAAPPPTQPAGGGLRDIWRNIGSTYEGEELPDDIARSNRRRAMLDAGMALLAGAGRQQPGEAIAAGMSAFRGGLDRESEGYLKRRRAGEEFDLQKRSAEESMAASRESRTRAATAEARAASEHGYVQESRAGAREAMRDLVREVEEIAGKDSDDADRARALFKGGPSLFGDLEAHHKGVLDRKQAPEVAREKAEVDTETEIERRKRLFAEDPGEVFNRRMEERRLGAYEGQVREQGLRTRAWVTPQQYNDDVRQEASTIYDVLVDEAKDRREQEEMTTATPAPIDYRALRSLAEREAAERVRLRYGGMAPSEAGGTPVTPEEVQAVRVALSGADEAQVRAGLLARGVPPAKADELLRQARGQ